MANGAFNRFFGGPPGWVIVRLAVISLIVGLIFSALGISPLDIVRNFERILRGIWNLGFEALADLFRYFLLGAVVVVPVWLVMRLTKVGKNGE
ncbi:DUF6460 domain-containing protein [Microbaculum marinisediminis]|uniref:DUF6460 domain-containing protein n=1 Tax=Microbaculum marinisediminis TaxID=2931392 RepID=A0AAW5QSS3_9HYPH|nr:DUF6460 domain-containing protein [Microbaculum sp. A6E488]MCT8970713.1 DUF6460 domain-containing protein [Microbaculum sp. A6E488]